MAIFGKKSETGNQPSMAAVAPVSVVRRKRSRRDPKRSFLGPGCVLDGEFHSDGSFECRGKFVGTVEVDGEIVIGRGGTAAAHLTAKRIVIEGRLEGDAMGGEKVEVGATGHVEGDVRAPAVLFAEGAFFEGNVEMRRAGGQEPEDAGSVENDATAADSDEAGSSDGVESHGAP